MSSSEGNNNGGSRRGKVTASVRARRSRAHADAAEAGRQLAAAARQLKFESSSTVAGAGGEQGVSLATLSQQFLDLTGAVKSLAAGVEANQGALKALSQAGAKRASEGGISSLGVIIDDSGLGDATNGFAETLGEDQEWNDEFTSALESGNLLENSEFLDRFRISSESVRQILQDEGYLDKDDVEGFLVAAQALYKEAGAAPTAKQRQVERHDPLANYAARRLQSTDVPAVKVFAFGRCMVGAGSYYDMLALCATKNASQRSLAEAFVSEAAGIGMDGSLVNDLDVVTLVRATRTLEVLAWLGGPGTAATVAKAMDGIRNVLHHSPGNPTDALERVNDFLRQVWDHRNAHVVDWFAGRLGPHVVDPRKAAKLAGVAGLKESRYGSPLLRAAAKRLAEFSAVVTVVTAHNVALQEQVSTLQRRVDELSRGGANGGGGAGGGNGGGAGGSGSGSKKWTRKSAKKFIHGIKHNLTSALGPNGANPAKVPQEVLDAGFVGSKVCLCFAAKQKGLCNVSAACQEAYCESVKSYSGEVVDGEGKKKSVKWEACKAGFHRTLKPKAN